MSQIPLYLRPNHHAAGEAMGYNQAQLAMLDEFAERGFVTFDVESDDFDRLASRIIEEVEPDYGADGRVQDAWRSHAPVKTLALNTSVHDMLRTLYGREPFAFQTLNFNKGTEQDTHSDTVHFDSVPQGFMAGVWVALEDIDVNNGPLHYYPGSHKLPHLTLAHAGVRASEGLGDNYDKYYVPMIQELVKQNGLTKEEGYIRRGQAIIWSANLLHGGSPVLEAGRTRHSQVTHYYFNDCAYFTPLFSDTYLGRTYHREPVDISTGKERRGWYGGRNAPSAERNFAQRALSWIDRRIVNR